MEFCPLDLASEPLWDEFCNNTPGAWFWHTTDFLKYQHAYRPEVATLPLHFTARRNGKVVGICPLAKETIKRGEITYPVFSLGEDLIPGPIVESSLPLSDRDRILKTMLREVDRLASIHGAAKVGFRADGLAPRFLEPVNVPIHDLLDFGFMDVSIRTQVIDLRLPLDQLWSDVRKRYHSLIHKGERQFVFRVLNQNDITEKGFGAYQALHRKAAGRLTRPLETFQRMLNWIQKGDAFLAQLEKDGAVASSVLVIVYKGKAYYASGCNDPELENLYPMGHLLQWKIIVELKKLGVSHYELGWQPGVSTFGMSSTPKELSIASFKRAFGGFTLPLYRSLKYYNTEFFKKEAASWMEAEGMRISAGLETRQSEGEGA
jgi:hypothetical protein